MRRVGVDVGAPVIVRPFSIRCTNASNHKLIHLPSVSCIQIADIVFNGFVAGNDRG